MLLAATTGWLLLLWQRQTAWRKENFRREHDVTIVKPSHKK